VVRERGLSESRRTENWHACYAVVDVVAAQPASFVRVPYDIKTVTDAIRASEPPDEFAVDLERGGAAPSPICGRPLDRWPVRLRAFEHVASGLAAQLRIWMSLRDIRNRLDEQVEA
jgi:hypothetical protein